jgi:hypothetical protein
LNRLDLSVRRFNDRAKKDGSCIVQSMMSRMAEMGQWNLSVENRNQDALTRRVLELEEGAGRAEVAAGAVRDVEAVFWEARS